MIPRSKYSYRVRNFSQSSQHFSGEYFTEKQNIQILMKVETNEKLLQLEFLSHL